MTRPRVRCEERAGAPEACCPELPNELWRLIVRFMCKSHGICACKHLRAYACVSRLFYWHTYTHPD